MQDCTAGQEEVILIQELVNACSRASVCGIKETTVVRGYCGQKVKKTWYLQNVLKRQLTMWSMLSHMQKYGSQLKQQNAH